MNDRLRDELIYREMDVCELELTLIKYGYEKITNHNDLESCKKTHEFITLKNNSSKVLVLRFYMIEDFYDDWGFIFYIHSVREYKDIDDYIETSCITIEEYLEMGR